MFCLAADDFGSEEEDEFGEEGEDGGSDYEAKRGKKGKKAKPEKPAKKTPKRKRPAGAFPLRRAPGMHPAWAYPKPLDPLRFFK